jgi:hypothetical protein
MQEEEPKKPEETGGTAAPQGPEEENPNSVKASRDFTRRNVFHVVCAGYLLYLAVKLGRDFVTNIRSSGWNGDTIVCLAGAVVFSAVAVVLLVGFFRRLSARSHENSEHDSDE